MRASPLRLSVLAAATALLLGALGLAWHALHFGLTDGASAARLERDVRQLVLERTRQVTSLAKRVSGDGTLVETAEANPDSLPLLFTHLQSERTHTADAERVSITVYVPTVSRGEYRVLAWSDGAAESVDAKRLAGPPALFVSPGTGGLLLVFVQPIEAHGRRIGIAAAQTVLAPAAPVVAATQQIDTSFGPVTVEHALYEGAGGAGGESSAFVIQSANHEPLLRVVYSRDALAADRRQGFHRVAAIAAMPLVVLVLLLTGRLLARRARTRTPAPFIAWSGLVAGLLGLGAAATGQLARALGLANALDDTLISLAVLAAAALLPVSLWWRPGRRLHARAATLRFVLEQALAGAVVATLLLLLARVSQDRITAASLATREFPLFPLDRGGLTSLVSRLLLQLALCWTMASLLGALASRWRLTWRAPKLGLGAAGLWLAPAAVALALMPGLPPLPPAVWAPIAAAIAAFALLSTSLRRYYRRTTQAMRLLLLFGSLFLPTLALYPMAAFYADATTRRVIETEYSPVMAEQPQRARAELALTQTEIDARLPRLMALITSALANPLRSQDAFTVWRETSLSLSRATSDVELYGPDGSLVSRFALNIPEYTYNARVQTWQGSGCAWQTFDEPRRLGTEERRVFRAERGLCDPTGGFLGAVVVHVVLDYQALPFVTSANPYADVLPASVRSPVTSHVADLQVVVYGWSLSPTSPSGQVAWPITPDLFARLYRSRDPFWATLGAVDRLYRVRFTSDRGGIYAIGYPVASAFEHATRLAESAALTGALFVVFLVGAAVYGPFAGRRNAPLRVLFDEIRTSFYRKVFLFFVFAAIVPVLMFALAFGAYMQSKFHADVESEATSVVTVARRVLEELAAAPDQAPTAPTDDIMVWIGQVIHQHVNLFEGSQLKATSQRDLFESGLLPTRTPAGAYRSIALDRLPATVIEDRLGAFQYQVAAAPVPAYGKDSVLIVPLALRQREIEQQIADLNRGVLVGAVVVVLFAAGLGASVAGRISDPVARLTRATRQIAAGQLDVRIVADTADELRRLVDDFNSMAATLVAQRAALARTNQLKAWNEMARQVAHEIKNPLTPIQLSTEHLQRVHEDAHRPLGQVFDQCTSTILRQVRLLRQIAAEFSNFAGEPTPRPADVVVADLVEEVVAPYRTGLQTRIAIEISPPAHALTMYVDRTLVARALTNVIENALHAMPSGGTLRVTSAPIDGARGLPPSRSFGGLAVASGGGGQTPGSSMVSITITDTGVGMDDEAVRRAFEPYLSTRTAGSGLGLANAKRNVELCGGTIVLASAPGRGTTVTATLPAAPPSVAPATG